ncbi:Sjogren's syndrome/scleroderma autoantigen 1 family protein [Methanocaldococcus fervens]|uniref:Sjogrens syndrome scleroderma autoantigen 1 n=1 Tax=Methanocaldococcus fervens (strain DSM 4213 / JCM 15782 / AG86) TaxID=573064 RepID=C7P8Z4_METFA|nr:Sjogren's syndrome/scleroderma autoantigen 1 family protein [Methanocaldococcus fervens]ACV25026.1 Sjogrens syndrome scleroderma autoantigen 1 [Methanocaldococcus fervens AG86]
MDDEILKTLSNELLNGARMLSTHCKKCGCPLFEKNGEIYCPICKKFEIDSESEKYAEDELNLNVDGVLNEKINYLVNKLKDEDEVGRIKEIGEALYILIKIKKKIKE